MSNDKLLAYLCSRGLSREVAVELIAVLPKKLGGSVGYFASGDKILHPSSWFDWSNDRFVLVGQCPNGDGIALDSTDSAGAVYYVSHELVYDEELALEDVVVKVADSPGDFVKQCKSNKKFPVDFWEAREG